MISERPDMRRFVPGSAVPADVLARLLHAAHAASSVGLMQPWRFIRITDQSLRRRIHALVDEERQLTAHALGRRGVIGIKPFSADHSPFNLIDTGYDASTRII